MVATWLFNVTNHDASLSSFQISLFSLLPLPDKITIRHDKTEQFILSAFGYVTTSTRTRNI